MCVRSDGAGEPRVVAGGHDFVSYPRLSPDGRHLVWTTWDHPQMPWDGTELWIGEIAGEGRLEGVVKLAGGSEESIYQPTWSPQGVLHFVSDRSGWWNLYRWRDGACEALAPMSGLYPSPGTRAWTKKGVLMQAAQGITKGDVLQRVASIGFVVGGIATVGANALFPRSADPGIIAERLTTAGENESLQRIALLVLIIGFWGLLVGAVGVYRSLPTGTAAAWARLGRLMFTNQRPPSRARPQVCAT